MEAWKTVLHYPKVSRQKVQWMRRCGHAASRRREFPTKSFFRSKGRERRSTAWKGLGLLRRCGLLLQRRTEDAWWFVGSEPIIAQEFGERDGVLKVHRFDHEGVGA